MKSLPTEGGLVRYFRQRPRVRPPCRVDNARPLRQTEEVTGRDSESPDRERLADAVLSARERLRVSQEEFAERCGLALKTIQRVENAQITPRTTTFSGLDQGAGWVSGSARGVFRDGREPVMADVDAMAKERVRAEVVRRLANVKKHFPVEYQLLMETVRSGEVTDAEVDRAITEL